MRDPNPIIVLQRFDNAIEANIIKTKLDAYGIPCFLTEENLTSLTTAFLSGGIRLHIFEQDKDQVIRILTQEIMQKNEDDDLTHCPRCRSKKILILSNDRFAVNAIVKFILNLTKRHYCLDCELEFD